MFVGFKSLDLFASFGVLSAGDVDSETSHRELPERPDVNEKVQYLFVGQGTEEAKGRMGQRCVALHEALLKHGVRHEYYVGGHGGHDWATWRHLVHDRFLPGLWRDEAQPAPATPAPPADSRPARTNVLGAEYPRVTDDSRVIFRFKAPHAQRVQADIMATKYDMVKDEKRRLDRDDTAPRSRLPLLPAGGGRHVDERPREPRVLRRRPGLQRHRDPGEGRRLLPAEGRPARPGAHGLVSLVGDGRLAPVPRLHASGLRHEPVAALPGAVPAARLRRGRDRLDRAGPRPLHPRQPDRGEEGRPDDHRDGQGLRRARRPGAAFRRAAHAWRTAPSASRADRAA